MVLIHFKAYAFSTFLIKNSFFSRRKFIIDLNNFCCGCFLNVHTNTPIGYRNGYRCFLVYYSLVISRLWWFNGGFSFNWIDLSDAGTGCWTDCVMMNYTKMYLIVWLVEISSKSTSTLKSGLATVEWPLNIWICTAECPSLSSNIYGWFCSTDLHNFCWRSMNCVCLYALLFLRVNFQNSKQQQWQNH